MRMNWHKTTLLASLAATFASPGAMAADHADGPLATLDKTADITDLFAWVSPDGKTTYLVLDIAKDAKVNDKFSNAVKYVFHTQSMPAYGAPSAMIKSRNIICTFDSGVLPKISCWVGIEDFVTGDASVTGGITSKSGKVKVFAGLRDDPFFFNLAGFQATADLVKAAAHPPAGGATLTFDKDGCPTGLGSTAQSLVAMLGSNPADGGNAVDSFATFNVLAIVMAVDTSLLTSGGPILSVWVSTNK